MSNSIKNYFSKLKFIFKEIFKAGPGVFFLSIISMVIDGISPVLTTYVTSEIINIIGSNINNFSTTIIAKLILLLSELLILITLSFSTGGIKKIVCQIAGLKLSHNIETLIAEKFQKIHQEKMDNPQFFDLYTNTLNQSGYEPLNIMESIFGLVSTFISVIGYSFIIIKFNLFAFFAIIIFAIPVIIYKKKVQGMLYNFFKSKTMQNRRIWYYFSLITDPKYSKEIRTFNLFNYFKEQRENEFNDFMKGNKKYAKKEGISTVISCLLSIIGAIFVEIWIVFQSLSGKILISDFYLLTTAIITIITKMILFSDLIASNNKSMLFLSYLFEFLNIENSFLDGNRKIDKKTEHMIEFVNVNFKYPGTDMYVLKNINLKINASESICLVGENGSGKSTLVKLLLRIYNPTEGKILLDNIDLKEYNIKLLRECFGVLFQDYINYSDSVRNCIGFGNIKKVNNLETIKLVASKINADKFIKNYKHKYDTNLSKMFSDDAIEPSGGQWQKIAIARAVFSNAPILILDEPTASLDPRAEEEMFEIFKKISKGRMAIIISHRMAITKNFDRIILLEKGEIVEQGSFSQLIKLKNKYYDMYNIQAKNYIDIYSDDNHINDI